MYRKQIDIENTPIILEILDTAGQEEYSTMRDPYIRPAHGFVLVYSIIHRSTFETLGEFRDSIIRVKDVDNFPMVIVGNKCDLEYSREVSVIEGQNLAIQYDSPFFESSAKTRINIDEVFNELVKEIIRKETIVVQPQRTYVSKKCVIL